MKGIANGFQIFQMLQFGDNVIMVHQTPEQCTASKKKYRIIQRSFSCPSTQENQVDKTVYCPNFGMHLYGQSIELVQQYVYLGQSSTDEY